MILQSRINGVPNEDKFSELVEAQCDILCSYKYRLIQGVRDGQATPNMGRLADQLCADHINVMHDMFENLISAGIFLGG